MPAHCSRRSLFLPLVFASMFATSVRAQARDSVSIVEVTPKGALRFGVPTDFTFVADVTLASADTAVLTASFNLDDPERYRMVATTALHRGTQRVTLHASAAPVDWSERGAQFGYSVNIRLLESLSADGSIRGLYSLRGTFGVGPAFVPDPTYFEFQVEKPVRRAAISAGPRYPVELRAAGVEGEVLVQFVVDSMGVPLMSTYRVLRSNHDMFSQAVRSALPDMRFTPAEVNGHKVRQLVQQPFVFAIAKGDKGAAPPGAGTVSAAERPALPQMSRAPAPRTGTLDGWTVEQRLTVDSGNGVPPIVSTIRSQGADGRSRTEIESAATLRIGRMVTLRDSASGRTTVLMPSVQQGTVMSRFERPGAPFRVEQTSHSQTITDLGNGERIADRPTHHYRVDGTYESRLSLGARACVLTMATSADYWTTHDPVIVEIQRRMRSLSRDMQANSPMMIAMADSNDLAKLGAPLKVVMHISAAEPPGTKPMTVAYEITAVSQGPLDASIFDPPEGYQLSEFPGLTPSVRTDSLRTQMAERLFDVMLKSMPSAPGQTAKCTPPGKP